MPRATVEEGSGVGEAEREREPERGRAEAGALVLVRLRAGGHVDMRCVERSKRRIQPVDARNFVTPIMVFLCPSPNPSPNPNPRHLANSVPYRLDCPSRCRPSTCRGVRAPACATLTELAQRRPKTDWPQLPILNPSPYSPVARKEGNDDLLNKPKTAICDLRSALVVLRFTFCVLLVSVLSGLGHTRLTW